MVPISRDGFLQPKSIGDRCSCLLVCWPVGLLAKYHQFPLTGPDHDHNAAQLATLVYW
jgi:hypothetical protein